MTLGFPCDPRVCKYHVCAASTDKRTCRKKAQFPLSMSSRCTAQKFPPQKSTLENNKMCFIYIFSNGGLSSTSNNERHFEEEEWDDNAVDPLVDNGEPGVKVRALYDYEAAESDELDFKAGTTKWYQ